MRVAISRASGQSLSRRTPAALDPSDTRHTLARSRSPPPQAVLRIDTKARARWPQRALALSGADTRTARRLAASLRPGSSTGRMRRMKPVGVFAMTYLLRHPVRDPPQAGRCRARARACRSREPPRRRPRRTRRCSGPSGAPPQPSRRASRRRLRRPCASAHGVSLKRSVSYTISATETPATSASATTPSTRVATRVSAAQTAAARTASG